MVPDITKNPPSIYLSLDVSKNLNFIALGTHRTPNMKCAMHHSNDFSKVNFSYNPDKNLFWEHSINFVVYLINLSITKKALVCYNIFWLLLASRFLSNPCLISRITSFILQYLCVVFHCYKNVHAWVPVVCLSYVANYRARALCDLVGVKVEQAEICFARVCAQNYSGSRFNALS